MKKRELKYMTEKGWVLEQKYFLYKSFLNLVVQVPAHFLKKMYLVQVLLKSIEKKYFF